MPQIPEEKFKEFATIHANWLDHPMTTLAFNAVLAHKQAIYQAMESNSMNPSASNDILRGQLFAAKSIDTLITMLKDFNVLAKRLDLIPITTPQE